MAMDVTNGKRRLARQSRVMARRCALLYAAMIGVGAALATVGAVARYAVLRGRFPRVAPLFADWLGNGGASNIESLMGGMLFAGGVIWFVAFVGPELCHGVARFPLVMAPAVCGTIAAALSAGVMTLAEAALVDQDDVVSVSSSVWDKIYFLWGNDLILMPFSYRFLYAWHLIPTSAGGIEETSGVIPGGWLFLAMACFALMLMAAALGMLVGAAVVWVCAGGSRRIIPGVCVVVVACAAGMGLFLFNSSVTVYWAASAMTGDVIRYMPNWNERHLYIAWIPLVESLVLLAVCVLIVLRLTLRREVLASRRWLV